MSTQKSQKKEKNGRKWEDAVKYWIFLFLKESLYSTVHDMLSKIHFYMENHMQLL